MFTRIKAPKFKIGRYVLNEYELRTLMTEVAEGKKTAGYIVKEGNISATILSNGGLSNTLPGLQIATDATLKLIRIRRSLTQL